MYANGENIYAIGTYTQKIVKQNDEIISLLKGIRADLEQLGRRAVDNEND